MKGGLSGPRHLGAINGEDGLAGGTVPLVGAGPGGEKHRGVRERGAQFRPVGRHRPVDRGDVAIEDLVPVRHLAAPSRSPVRHGLGVGEHLEHVITTATE